MNAEQGMVRIQAHTMFPARPQRTAETECVKCIACHKCAGACDCTGGPQIEPECTCYELTGGHQPGCYFNRPGGTTGTPR